MISPSASFNTYNASLQKDPVVTLEIDGYPRLLSTKKVRGVYNTSDFPLPYPTPSGQYVVWVTPTVAEFGDDSGAGGSNPTYGEVTSLSTSGARIERYHSASLGDTLTYAKWSGFSIPILPGGAVIQAIVGVYEAALWEPSGVEFGHSANAGGGHDFNGPPFHTTEDDPYGTFYTDSIGTSGGAITGAQILAQFLETLSYTGHAVFNIRNPRLAIYYTAPGGSLIGDPWIELIEGLGNEADILNGSSSMDDVTVSVLDYGRALTADMAIYTLEGKTCRLKTGFVGQDYADYMTLFTGLVKTIPSGDNDLIYRFTLNNTMLEMKKLIYETGDDGQPTDSDHPKTIVGNPLDIVKSILLDYLTLSPGMVDSTKLDAYRDQYFAGATMEFSITSPPEAKAFLEDQIFKPLGGYLWPNNLGVITPNFLVPLAGTAGSVKSLTNANMLTIPAADQADLINVISYRFDKAEDKYTTEIVIKNQASIDKYGQVPGSAIESDGMRSGYQAIFLAKLAASSIFDRYGDKNPTFGMECFWDCCVLQLGDEVDVTHALMPDRMAGTMGVTAALFEVVGITYDLVKFTVTLTLLDASFAASLGHWKVAPDAIADWTLASTSDKDTYMFISNSVGQYSDASAGHTLA